MKTVVSLTVNFTLERIPWLLCVCGNDKHFQQQRTLHKGRDAAHSDTVLTVSQGPHKVAFQKEQWHIYLCFWISLAVILPCKSGKPTECLYSCSKDYCLRFFIDISRKSFWKDILPHTHTQRLVACTGMFGWMYGVTGRTTVMLLRIHLALLTLNHNRVADFWL